MTSGTLHQAANHWRFHRASRGKALTKAPVQAQAQAPVQAQAQAPTQILPLHPHLAQAEALQVTLDPPRPRPPHRLRVSLQLETVAE